VIFDELRDLKIKTWKEKHASLSENELRQIALKMRRKDDDLKGIHSQVVQNVATRVYMAFRNYLEGRARFPKRKTEKRYRSFTYLSPASRSAAELLKGAVEPSSKADSTSPR